MEMSFTSFYILFIMSLFYIPQPSSTNKPGTEDSLRERVKLHNELNREYKKAQCCKKKLKCCVELPNAPKLEIRAVLVHCSNVKPCSIDPAMRRAKEPICRVKEHHIKQFHGFDEDDLTNEFSLTGCRKKLMLTIRISKHQFDPKKNQYVIVDHVYDPIDGRYTRIFNPYVIRFSQEPTMQIYPLKFLHVVNSKVREKVYSKRSVENYTGCDVSSDHPTCGELTYNGRPIPFCRGFCCSCDSYANYKRQPAQVRQYSTGDANYGDPAFLLGGIECPRNLKGDDNINEAQDLLDWKKHGGAEQDETEEHLRKGEANWELPLEKMKYDPLWSNTMTVKRPNSEKKYTVKIFSSPSNFHRGQAVPRRVKVLHDVKTPKVVLFEKPRPEIMDFISRQNVKTLNEEIEDLNGVLRARKTLHDRLHRRQVQPGGMQKRGGQNCADRFTPKNVNKTTYHESAHCLRFSDLWFTVYRLEPPLIEHSITLQIFEKQVGVDGMIHWKDLTNGRKARISTMMPTYLDPNGSYSLQFIPHVGDIDQTTFAINTKAGVLLVPEDVSQSTTQKYPEARGGPDEYLIVHASQVSLNGDQCNVAGVGFEAFFNQPNRCAKPQGSCLQNQPYDLWLHDHQAEKQKLRGCFFLRHFGKIPPDPIRNIKGHSEKYLFMEYNHPQVSKINIEIKADFNTMLRKAASAKITEVYTDNSSRERVVITVKITNSGLTSSKFMTKMTDCPLEIPAFFNNIHSNLVLIPPQHQHVFSMVVQCELPMDAFHCSIEALNYKHELVALRRIRLQKYDKCVCAWHCLSACTGSSEGMGCVPMSMQHYHAAGFQGSLPITSFTIHYTFFNDALFVIIMYIILTVAIILLMLGFCKACVGLCCCPIIGIIGLSVILDLPKRINKYHEWELKDMPVVYDREGWPIDPYTKRRMRNISHSTEFCVNLVFFFVYPLSIACLLVRKICCKPQRERVDNLPYLATYGYEGGGGSPGGSIGRDTSTGKPSSLRRGTSTRRDGLTKKEVTLSPVQPRRESLARERASTKFGSVQNDDDSLDRAIRSVQTEDDSLYKVRRSVQTGEENLVGKKTSVRGDSETSRRPSTSLRFLQTKEDSLTAVMLSSAQTRTGSLSGGQNWTRLSSVQPRRESLARERASTKFGSVQKDDDSLDRAIGSVQTEDDSLYRVRRSVQTGEENLVGEKTLVRGDSKTSRRPSTRLRSLKTKEDSLDAEMLSSAHTRTGSLSERRSWTRFSSVQPREVSLAEEMQSSIRSDSALSRESFPRKSIERQSIGTVPKRPSVRSVTPVESSESSNAVKLSTIVSVREDSEASIGDTEFTETFGTEDLEDSDLENVDLDDSRLQIRSGEEVNETEEGEDKDEGESEVTVEEEVSVQDKDREGFEEEKTAGDDGTQTEFTDENEEEIQIGTKSD